MLVCKWGEKLMSTKNMVDQLNLELQSFSHTSQTAVAGITLRAYVIYVAAV